ncbi:unnamed protein product [Lasius platythorax]|uniref:Uncharacterized protein n=1 Tax=Lasius platythorax TaxID=488582 RepID=A0AAV2NC70_9HYME
MGENVLRRKARRGNSPIDDEEADERVVTNFTGQRGRHYSSTGSPSFFFRERRRKFDDDAREIRYGR